MLFLVNGCGGAKLLRDPKPIVLAEPIASAVNRTLYASLTGVVCRDGPGSWAANADWDEYIVEVANTGASWVQITEVNLVDSLGYRIAPSDDRKHLVNGTKAAKVRYQMEGFQVKAGLDPLGILGGGAAVTAGTATVVGGSIAAVGVGSSWVAIPVYWGVAGTVSAGLVVVPGYAIYRAINNSKVNEQILARSTALPIELRDKQSKNLHVFFPITPSPCRIEIHYFDSQGSGALVLDTRNALQGIHLHPAESTPDYYGSC